MTAVDREAQEVCVQEAVPGVAGLLEAIWRAGCCEWVTRMQCGSLGGNLGVVVRARGSGCEVGPWLRLIPLSLS